MGTSKRSSMSMLFLIALLAACVFAVPVDVFSSVSHANANRARIASSINSDPSSSWTAAAIPVARFRDTPYSVLKSMAGVLGGDPQENEANLPVKSVEQLRERSAGAAIPDAFDSVAAWPQCPILKQIQDQSACGTCYAVSAASAATDRFCIAHNGTKSDRLSAVDLMSCCFTCKGSNGGCYGGTPSHCWDYMVQQGISSGGAYGDNSQCLQYPFPKCDHHFPKGTYGNCPAATYTSPTCFWKCDQNSTSKITYDQSQASHKFGSSYKLDNNVEAIQRDLMTHGPVQASMFLIDEFEIYKSGVFDTASTTYIGAHAVKIVGWGTDSNSSLPYWRVQNSWNAEWGEAGYFRIARGKNVLAIEAGVVAGTLDTW